MTRDFDDWYNEKVEQEEFFNLKTKDDWDKWVRDRIIRRIEKLETKDNLNSDYLGNLTNRLTELENKFRNEINFHGKCTIEEFENRVKKLEEWKSEIQNRDLEHIIPSSVDKRLKELEEWQLNHKYKLHGIDGNRDKVTLNFLERIEKLEDNLKKTYKNVARVDIEGSANHEARIKELEKRLPSRQKVIQRLKKLEDNQHNHGHTEILERIEKLEEWENGFKEDVITSFAKRIEKLEQGEDLTQQTENFLGQRVSKLEEWRQSHQNNYNFKEMHLTVGKHTEYLLSKKVIDKSAWDQIRLFLCDIFKGVPMSPGRVEYTKKLVEEQDLGRSQHE